MRSAMTENYDLLHHEGEARTDMDCHHCGKNFVALVDYSLNGNHIIECAHCGHEHHRVVRDGKVTEERFGSNNDSGGVVHRPRRVWKHNSVQATTSSASAFLRDRWLDKLQ